MKPLRKLLIHSILILFFTFSSSSIFGQTNTVDIVEYNMSFPTVTGAIVYLEQQNIISDIHVNLTSVDYPNEPSFISTQNINMNGYHLTLSGNSPTQKARILMDGTTAHVFDNYLSNITLSNLILQGADPSNLGGSILRIKGQENNITVDHVDFIGGYCGIRATTKINGLYLSNISSSQVPHGTFRLGNGDFSGSRKDSMLWERDSADYDMYNVVIKNITLHDDLNNADIPGTSKKYNGFLLLKKIMNLKVVGVVSTHGNGGGILSIENSRNVLVSKVNIDEFGFNQPTSSGLYIFKCDKIELSNNLLKTKAGDGNSHVLYHLIISDKLSFCHNTAVASKTNDRLLYGFQLSHFYHFEANLFKMKDYSNIIEFRTYDNYLATMNKDWQSIDFNAYSNSGQYLPLFNLQNLDQREYIIKHNGYATGADQIDLSTLHSTFAKESNSQSGFPEGSIEFHSNTFYQTNSSIGRNLVTVNYISEDIKGYSRTLPTDAGAFDSDNSPNVGLGEFKKLEDKISLYPNPSKGSFNIDFENRNFGNLEIKIFDSAGKNIAYSSLQPDTKGNIHNVKIEVASDLPKDIYHIQLLMDTTLVSKSFSKL